MAPLPLVSIENEDDVSVERPIHAMKSKPSVSIVLPVARKQQSDNPRSRMSTVAKKPRKTLVSFFLQVMYSGLFQDLL